MGFVHLHVHSQYSFLDGASSLDKLLEKAANLDMLALAITDHDRLTGAIRFYDKAKAMGIKPIIGAEVTMEGGYHLTLLCKNIKGYSNLCQLLTQAHLSNRNIKAEASLETLSKHSDGLICLSGCDRGELPTLCTKGYAEKAREAAHFYRELFGNDFFVELIHYPSRDGMTSSRMIADFAKEEGLPIIATNNVHYAEMEEYRIKELLNAIDQNIPVA